MLPTALALPAARAAAARRRFPARRRGVGGPSVKARRAVPVAGVVDDDPGAYLHPDPGQVRRPVQAAPQVGMVAANVEAEPDEVDVHALCLLDGRTDALFQQA